MASSPEFLYISYLDDSVDYRASSLAYQLGTVPNHPFNPLVPSQDYDFMYFLEHDFGNWADSPTHQITSPTQPNNHPVSSRAPKARRSLRHGCRLCPGLHFDRKFQKSTKDSNNGLQHHITKKHPEVANWEDQAYDWGRRVYRDGAMTEEPFAGSAPSAMKAKSGKGSVVTKEMRKERREADERVKRGQEQTQDQPMADEDDVTNYLDPLLLIN